MADPDWRHLPSLSSLRAFETAARLGGFSSAARALNVTHAAVAQAVRGLESDLGTTLLRREGRGLALTEEGARLARSLREGFSTIVAGVEALRAAERRWGLRITTTPAFAQQVLLPRLADFWARHPDTPVSISPGLALADLAREGIDLAVRAGPGRWPGLRAEPLLEAQLLVVGAPSLLEREADPARLPWIVDRADEQEMGWLRAAGLDPAALTVAGLDAAPLALPAARAGYGVLFATEAVVKEDLIAGRLRAVPFPGLPRFRFWIVTLEGPRSAAVERFATWLKGQFGDTGFT